MPKEDAELTIHIKQSVFADDIDLIRLHHKDMQSLLISQKLYSIVVLHFLKILPIDGHKHEASKQLPS